MKEKDFWEKKALHTLQYTCNFDILNWKCFDKPDLQSSVEAYGIEVVRDVYEHEQKMSRFIETVSSTHYSKIDSRKLDKFRELGGSFELSESGFICSASSGTTDNNPNHLIETISKKIRLINQVDYQYFNRYGLYVFVDTVFIDKYFESYVQRVVDDAVRLQAEYKIKYDTLYLDQNYIFYICNLKDKTFNYFYISQEIRERIHKELQEYG